MPCDGTATDEFNEVLDEIYSVSQLINAHYIMIAGDFNTDFSRTNSSNTRLLLQYMEDNSLKCGLSHNSCDVVYTFESKSSRSSSIPDPFLLGESLYEKKLSYQSAHSVHDNSFHCAVSLKLDTSINHVDDLDGSQPTNPATRRPK